MGSDMAGRWRSLRRIDVRFNQLTTLPESIRYVCHLLFFEVRY
jgi:hypothetical protein